MRNEKITSLVRGALIALSITSCPAAAEGLSWDAQDLESYVIDESYTHPYEEKTKEQLILERIEADEERKKQAQKRVFEADKKRWGECYGFMHQYDWLGWKKAINGTWVTDYRYCWMDHDWPKHEVKGSIGITCKGLKITELRKILPKWSEWRDPYSIDEKKLIAKLCARELK